MAVHGGVVGVVDEGSSVVIVTILHDMAKRIMNNEASVHPNYRTQHTSNKQHRGSMQHLLFFFRAMLDLFFGRLWNVRDLLRTCVLFDEGRVMRGETESLECAVTSQPIGLIVTAPTKSALFLPRAAPSSVAA